MMDEDEQSDVIYDEKDEDFQYENQAFNEEMYEPFIHNDDMLQDLFQNLEEEIIFEDDVNTIYESSDQNDDHEEELSKKE